MSLDGRSDGFAAEAAASDAPVTSPKRGAERLPSCEARQKDAARGEEKANRDTTSFRNALKSLKLNEKRFSNRDSHAVLFFSFLRLAAHESADHRTPSARVEFSCPCLASPERHTLQWPSGTSGRRG